MNIPHYIKVSFRLDQVQFEKVKSGHIPKDTEDKWFIYYEDNWIYFFGSKTGYLIYKCRIYHNGSKYEIRDLYAERDAQMYGNTDDLTDIRELKHLIEIH